MKRNLITLPTAFFILVSCLVFNGCVNSSGDANKKGAQSTTYPSDVIPFFEHWNLILGDGSNAGPAVDFEHEDFFFVANDDEGDWVAYKTPNAGNTHGTSNNTRTELAQLKKWSIIIMLNGLKDIFS